MAQLAMISNMVAELQGPEGLGAMMLPKSMTAVFYALAAALIYTAWTFVQELSMREKERVLVEEAAEAMTLYIAPLTGARVHTRQSCRGLQNAGNVRTMFPCNNCCPNEFTRAERVHRKAGRRFIEVKSKYFWFRIFLAILLMVTAAQLLQAGHNFEKYLSNSSSAQEAPLAKNLQQNSGVRKRSSPVEALPAGRSTHSIPAVDGGEDDKVELWQRSIYKNEPNAAKFFSVYKTIFMVFYKHLIEYIDYMFDYLAEARRSLGSREETHGYVVRTCQKLSIFLCTPVGLATWAMIHFFLARRQKKLKAKSRHLSRIQVHRHVRCYRGWRKTCLLLVLVYTNLQSASAMDQALQQLAQLTEQNTQQIHRLTEAVATQQQQAAAVSEATNRAIAASQQQAAAALEQAAAQSSKAIAQLAEEASKKKDNIGEVELHKMIKSPDIFSPSTYKEEKEQYPEFRVKMRSWIGALDSSLLEKINVVENARSEKLIHEEFTPRTIDKSKKLYSILASYTTGRPLRTIKQVQDENGFEAWRLLLEEHLPRTRARSLQLLSNLIHTKFDSKRTTMENILKFEDSIEEYEKSSSDSVQDDLKVSVVLGNTEGPLRQHLLLNVKETTKYSTLRQFLVSYEQTTRWTTTDLINSGKDHGGQADMDISRIKGEEKGGKGKGKGKMSWKGRFGGGKGKKGRGKGKGYGNHFYKGKGRGTYKGGKKGRGKGRGRSYKGGFKSKSRGFGSGAPNVGLCHYCHKPGHYEANCRQKQRDLQSSNIRQAQQDDQQSVAPSSSSTTVPTSASTRSTSISSQQLPHKPNPTIRQVSMYHIGEQPETLPEQFDLDEDEEEAEINYFGRILRVEEYSLSDHEEHPMDEEDLLLQWYSGELDEEEYLSEQKQPMCVRMINEHFFEDSPVHQQIEVILDSGADASLIPLWLAKEGTPLKKNSNRHGGLQDAQGNRIPQKGLRLLTLTFVKPSRNGEPPSMCRITEAFIVADVLNPLLAIGKLVREGWEIITTDEGRVFVDPERETEIPVHFKKNSLASFAFIQTTEKQKKYSQADCVLDIRTIVHLNSHIEKVVEKDDPGWQNTDSLVVVKYSRSQASYEDPTYVFPSNYFPYRSTLVKDSEGNWKVLEISKRYAQKREQFEDFEKETETITALSSGSIPLCILGVPVSSQERSDQEGRTSDYWCIENGGKELVRYHSTPRTTRFSPEAVKGIPVEISNLEQRRRTIGECIYGLSLYEDEDLWQGDINPAEEPFPLPWYGQTRFDLKEAVPVPQAEAKAAKPRPKAESRPVLDPVPEEAMEVDDEAQAPAEMIEVRENSFYHEGVEYNAAESSLKELQALCREYQLKTQGSKKQLLSRLATAVREERLESQLQQRRQDYRENVVPFQQQPTSRPSDEEVEMHNLTHLPFQPWCEHCVATRGKEDPHKQSITKATSSDDSSKPWLSFDFCYTSTSNCTDPPAVALVMTDNWSKAFLSVPVKKRGGQASILHMVEGIVHFVQDSQGTSSEEAWSFRTLYNIG